MSRVETTRQAPRPLALTVRSLLTRRSLPLAAALLSVVLALPALRAGWMLDDYFHRAILLQRSRFRDLLGPPSEMFRFFRGDPDRTGRIMDIGLYPWWTYPDLKADANFQQLQAELTDIENKLAASRRFFNNAVQEYNTGIQQFPAALFAGMFGFGPREFFDVGEERKTLDQAPQVKF